MQRYEKVGQSESESDWSRDEKKADYSQDEGETDVELSQVSGMLAWIAVTCSRRRTWLSQLPSPVVRSGRRQHYSRRQLVARCLVRGEGVIRGSTLCLPWSECMCWTRLRPSLRGQGA